MDRGREGLPQSALGPSVPRFPLFEASRPLLPRLASLAGSSPGRLPSQGWLRSEDKGCPGSLCSLASEFTH